VQYDAFISYSHAADGELAPALQDGLQRLAKPWNRRRALEVFRDQTGLSASPHLWGSIVEGLDNARWFVHLASQEAAASEWVGKEIEHWRAAHPGGEGMVLVLTDGTMRWDSATNDFSADSTAVHPALRGVFAEEPLYVDLTWAKRVVHLELRNPQFKGAVAHIAAPVRGVHPDDLISEDIRQFKKAKRIRGGAVAGLAVLTVAALVASVVAVQQRSDAQAQRNEAIKQKVDADRQRNEAVKQKQAADDATKLANENAAESRSRELAALASSTMPDDPVTASLLAVEANYPNGAQTLSGSVESRNEVGITLRAIAGAQSMRGGPTITASATDVVAVDGTRIATIDQGAGTLTPSGVLKAPTWWDTATGQKLQVSMTPAEVRRVLVPFDATVTTSDSVARSDLHLGAVAFGAPVAVDAARHRLVGLDSTTGDVVTESLPSGRVVSRLRIGDAATVVQVELLHSGEVLAVLDDGVVSVGVVGRTGIATKIPFRTRVRSVAAAGSHRLVVQYGLSDNVGLDNTSSVSKVPAAMALVDISAPSSPREVLRINDPFETPPGALEVAPDRSAVLGLQGSFTGSDSDTLGVWSLRTGLRMATIDTFDGSDAAWLGPHGFVVTSGRGIATYELRSKVVLGVPVGNQSIDVSSNRTALWNSRTDRLELIEHPLASDSRLGTALIDDGNRAVGRSISLSADGAYVAMTVPNLDPSTQGAVVVEVASRRQVARFSHVTAVAFDPKGHRLAVGTVGSLRFVDSASWKPTGVPLVDGMSPTQILWSADGSVVVAGGCKGCDPARPMVGGPVSYEAVALDTLTGVVTPLGVTNAGAMAVSGDGRTVAIDQVGTVQTFHRNAAGTGFDRGESWSADPSYVFGLAFSTDGLRLLTVSQRRVVVWDIAQQSFPSVQQVISDLPALSRYSLPMRADGTADEVGVWRNVLRRPGGTSFVLSGPSGVVELPDFDPALACRQATKADLAAVAKILGAPSACTRVPELMTKG
jgi:WD40 repeat protein